jgi:hypothetical protein
MIQGQYKGKEFEINEGVLTGDSPRLEQAFAFIAEDPPGPSEGDPDYVLFERLKSQFPSITLVKYIPMKLDPDVVY